ncbi:MAG: hypothetical protein IKO05_07660 [Selenomonadaceae bacterium]|nr:hypothetical protein [Selenomonadaceae bacterium]
MKKFIPEKSSGIFLVARLKKIFFTPERNLNAANFFCAKTSVQSPRKIFTPEGNLNAANFFCAANSAQSPRKIRQKNFPEKFSGILFLIFDFRQQSQI